MFDQRKPSSPCLIAAVYIIPFLSFYFPCGLPHSPSLSLFSITPPPVLPLLMDPSDPFLLKMCLFPSFAFKDVSLRQAGTWMCPASVLRRAVRLIKTTEMWRCRVRRCCRQMHQLSHGGDRVHTAITHTSPKRNRQSSTERSF